MKPASKTVGKQGERSLIDYFGTERLVESITAAEADAYKQHLIGTKSAAFTVRTRLQCAQRIFNVVQTCGRIAANPFATVQPAAVVDASRNVLVSRDDVAKFM